ncbi:MAG: UbiD family decarboxylase [Hyphomicrobiales bacterium]|nr:UbiD family decarboxylase [Hyphomicrobiales bacterium]
MAPQPDVGCPDRLETTGTSVSALIAYTDLREWIEEARKLGEIRQIKGLSWESDIGQVSELVLHDDTAHCLIFEDVPNSLPGSRVLINFFGGTRKNMTLGFPPHLSKVELSEAFRETFLAKPRRIQPKVVANGPIMENILTGDSIDVTQFPTPMWHKRDGGRYIGTGTFSVTRHPDEHWINCGTYRAMIHSRTSVGLSLAPGKHARYMREKYRARNEPMPIAVVFGGDPLTFLMACSDIPYGVCEYEIVGGMRGAPVEVINGPVTGLPIPANGEIVIEGFIQPDSDKIEGPFGEWTGYYESKLRASPVVDIKALYHRDNPVILGCPPQTPPDELARYRAIVRSGLLRESIEKTGVPGIKAAWAHEVGSARLLLAVSVTQRYPGHARQAGHVAAMCQVGAYSGRYIIVVDDDIDVANLEELIWAVLTRSDPATSIEIIRGAWSSPLDPRIEPERKAAGDMTNSRAVIDACRPFHWRDKFPPVNAPTPEERKAAMEKFGHLVAR